MALELASVRAKLSRSQEHAQAFKNEFLAWSNRHPYSLVKQRNTDYTRHSLIIRVNELPPIQRWSLLIADAFNNLRNALDHLVFAIAVHEVAPNTPSYEDTLQFPIADCRKRFDKAVNNRHYLGTISDPVRAAIQSSQPYNRPHPTLPPLLSILRDFTNADKHKLLHLGLVNMIQADIGFAGVLAPGTNCTAVPFSGEIKDGTEIFAIACDGPAPEMNFDRHIVDVAVTIQHVKRDPLGPDWTGRTEFASLYEEMSAVVRGVVHEVAGAVK